MTYDTTIINQLIRNRRSVFPDQFDTTKKIDDAIIREIVTNACWAPNHGQTEPWHFTVITGDSLKAFAEFQATVYKNNAGENFNEGKHNKLLQQPLKASHIIALGMKRTTTKNIPEIEDIEAVACAVQNIYISATAYNIGGYWTTGGITYLDEAKSFFNLGNEDKLLGFFYLGYVAIPSPPAKRKPLEEKMTWMD